MEKVSLKLIKNQNEKFYNTMEKSKRTLLNNLQFESESSYEKVLNLDIILKTLQVIEDNEGIVWDKVDYLMVTEHDFCDPHYELLKGSFKKAWFGILEKERKIAESDLTDLLKNELIEKELTEVYNTYCWALNCLFITRKIRHIKLDKRCLRILKDSNIILDEADDSFRWFEGEE